MRPEVQPQSRPSLSATRNDASVNESSAAPGTSSRVGVRIGDFGTTATTATTATATTAAPTTNSQRQEAWSTITPESGSPSPPAAPKTAEIAPIAAPLRSRGNSSLTIAKLRGKTAPPAP